MSSKKSNTSSFYKTIKSILFALIVALFIRYIFIQPFKIPSKSMYPTLLVGDQILVDRISYGLGFPCSESKIIPSFKTIKRGDVIVFRYPEDLKSKNCPNGGFIGLTSIYYIKRVVGIPGDKIEIIGKDLLINGVSVSSNSGKTYMLDQVSHQIFTNRLSMKDINVIYDKKLDSLRNKLNFGEIIIPTGSYFVLGDNRDNSKDSRFWGFVPRENIVGKAFMIHFSWNNNFKNVKDILRLDRFFDRIN